ncbi:recombinase family protein [Collinsella sp. zg1085]|nr:recombinase family protein [Collinsella sp. zg1085]
MNVGIYCRVSTGEKNQLNSLAAQIATLTRAVANVEQWKLTDTFIDIASAKGESPRREFERMIREAQAHHISVILTKSINRFGRDTVDTLEALRKLKAAGVRVIFDEDGLDTDVVDDELLISIAESFAQAENETRSMNIRIGLRNRALNGSSGNYRKRLYGYVKDNDGNLVISPTQAQVVRDIFRWYIDGASILGIIKKLAEHKIPSPTGKEHWSKRSVDTLLSNEKYIGTVRLVDSVTREQMFEMKDSHPPIITEDVFRAAKETRAKRSNIVVSEAGERQRKSTKYSSKNSK